MNNLQRQLSPEITERIASHTNNRLKPGDQFPDVILTRYNSTGTRENYSTAGELKGRRVVIFTVPGAFTATCTGKHLAGFKESAQKILSLQVDEIICIAPDKVDVAKAWNEVHGDPSSIKIWADNLGELTDKMGLGINLSGDRGLAMGLMRSVMIVKDGKVEMIAIEKAAAECTISHANSVITYLEHA